MWKLRNKRLVRRVTGLLSALLLLQGLFPLHAHTELRLNSNGQLVEVCTIDGMRTYVLDEQGIVHQDQDQPSTPSSAVAFSQILAEALPDLPVFIYLPLPTDFENLPDLRVSLVTVSPAKSRPIRAPPV